MTHVAGRSTTVAILTAVALVTTMVTATVAAAAPQPAAREVFAADEIDRSVRGGAPTGAFHDDARGRSGEVERLRTQDSKTYVTRFGAYQTEFFTSSVHYLDGERWAPIDNSLVTSDREGYGYRNKANRFALHLPPTLGGRPIRVEHGGAWATFVLDSASPAARAEAAGNRATYRGAFPGVDVAYEVLSDTIKEELLLASPAATSSFTWTVRTSPGVTPKANPAGGIDFVDGDGTVQLVVHSPVVYDASDTDAGIAPPHAYSLREAAGGYEIGLKVDEQWLHAAAREFPVTVDPSVDFASRDCQIQDGDKAATNFCTLAKIKVGNTGNYKKRALLRWDVGTIPDNAEILDAKAGLWVEGTYAYVSNAFSFRPITEGPWDNEATWNRRTASATWSTPGGVFDDGKGYKEQDVPGVTGWVFWHPTDLVKQWVAGTVENRGAVVKQTYEAQVNGELHLTGTESTNTDHWPTLTVTWDHGGMGEQKTYSLEEHRLTDRADLAVNPAGGNLSVRHTDLEVSGTGLDLKIERNYNSLLPVEAVDTGSHVGDGWNLGTAGDVGLKLFEDGSAAYFDPSGYRAPYTKDPEDPLQNQASTKDFVTPPGPDADLTKVNVSAQRTYKLTQEKSKEKYFFSDRGVLTAHEDKNGNAIQFAYTGDLLTTITDTQGRSVHLDYDTAGNLVTLQDSAGRIHRYGYEGQHLVSYTNPQNETYSYSYASGHLASITDPRGNVTKFTYDGSWRVTSITVVDDKGDSDPADDTTHATTFTYYPSDSACPQEEGGYLQSTVVTDMRGNNTRYCYNKMSRVREIEDSKGNPTSLQYNSDANVTSITNDKGKTVFGYDPSGQDVVSVTSPDEATPSGGSVAGAASNVEYGNDGHAGHPEHAHLPVKVTTAEGFSTEFDYDANHNLVKVTKAPNTLNDVFSYEYDARGNLTRVAAPEGPPDPDPSTNDPANDTTFDYYANGDLQRINYPEPLGPMTFEYDTLSRVTATTDGAGRRTQYTYDAVDRLTSVTYSDGSSITYEYDRAGNLVRETDVPQPGALPETADYVYDSRNRLVHEARADDRSVVRYTYDAAGNLTSVDDDNDGSTGRVEYRYDSTNVLDRITEPDGDHITYQINTTYEPWQISYPAKDGTTDQRVVVDIRYWNSGKVKSIKATAPGSSQPFTHIEYDYTDESSGKQQSLLQKVTDKDGKVTKFEYDQMSRLTRAETTHNGSLLRFFAYDYDANSNRTLENDNGTKTQYHYSPANTLVCSYGGARSSCDLAVGNTTYSYDRVGNLTGVDDTLTVAAPDAAYTYDARNHNTRVRTADGSTVEMDYLGATEERRRMKKVTPSGGASYTIGYSSNSLGLSAEGRYDGNNQTYYVRDNEGRPVGRFNAGATAEDYYVLDSQGSVTDVFDTAGNVRKAYTYEPYGEIWWQNAADVYNPLRYGQGYLDSETGLTKLGVRYYDNDTARFTQVDPVKGTLDDPVTLNLYQYAKMNPTNFNDPTGRWHCGLLAGGSAVLGLAGIAGIFLFSNPFTAAAITFSVVTFGFSGIALLAQFQTGCLE